VSVRHCVAEVEVILRGSGVVCGCAVVENGDALPSGSLMAGGELPSRTVDKGNGGRV
jgi:hypothetical protein